MKKYKARGQRSVDKARAILEQNIYRIYHLQKKKIYIRSALDMDKENQPLRDLLLKILNFCKNVEPVIYRQKYVYHLDNGRITYEFRGNQSTGTASRYFNYLCAMGLLKKQAQIPGKKTLINEQFQEQTKRPRPINVVSIPEYTNSCLNQIEARTEALLLNKVTKGNISRNKLMAVGLADLANEVFPLNQKKAYPNAKKQYQRLEQVIEQALKDQGYIYIGQVAEALEMPEKDVKGLKRIFNEDFESKYRYGATTAVQAEQYNIPTKKWIITRRKEDYGKS